MSVDLLAWGSIRAMAPGGGLPPGAGRRGDESQRRLMAQRAAIAAVAAREEGRASSGARPARA
ncbi:MAG: hypothetical protein AAGC46_15735 [Solirubrobacteraceae bacterium]|nr:hypothetical protein [Patulibacter sp.]